MKALLQRVTRAAVRVDGSTVGDIGHGMVVLLGVEQEDSGEDVNYLRDKISNLRIFADKDNKFNLSALDIRAEFLVVSQFTLLADTRKGRRPSFVRAAPPEEAESLIEEFVGLMRETGLRVETGRFQAYMEVELVNDGPVTIWLDSADRNRPRRG